MKHLFPFGLPLPVFNTPDGVQSPPPPPPPANTPPADPPANTPPANTPPANTPPANTPPTNALAAGDADDVPPKETPADWPADWREKLAAGDTKRLEQLKRINSPLDLGKSWFDAQTKIRSGQPAADEPMPDDPEKAKEWRQARGIPADATGYETPAEIAAKLTDADKPIVAGFFEEMHKVGLPAKFAGPMLAWYTELTRQGAEEQEKADKDAALATRDALRDEWGADFKPQSTMAKRYAEEAIPGVNWFEARLPDGRTLGNVPEVVKALAKFGKLEFGDAAFVGGETGRQTSDRLEELTKIMKTDWPRWEKSPDLQKEHYQLTEAKLKRDAALANR